MVVVVVGFFNEEMGCFFPLFGSVLKISAWCVALLPSSQKPYFMQEQAVHVSIFLFSYHIGSDGLL